MKLKALALEMLCIEARYDKMLNRVKKDKNEEIEEIEDQFDLFVLGMEKNSPKLFLVSSKEYEDELCNHTLDKNFYLNSAKILKKQF